MVIYDTCVLWILQTNILNIAYFTH